MTRNFNEECPACGYKCLTPQQCEAAKTEQPNFLKDWDKGGHTKAHLVTWGNSNPNNNIPRQPVELSDEAFESFLDRYELECIRYGASEYSNSTDKLQQARKAVVKCFNERPMRESGSLGIEFANAYNWAHARGYYSKAAEAIIIDHGGMIVTTSIEGQS